MRARYLLNTPRIHEIVDAKHLTHFAVAAELGVSRWHWSQLVNRRRPASAGVRRRMLRSEVFADITEAELWTVCPLNSEAA